MSAMRASPPSPAPASDWRPKALVVAAVLVLIPPLLFAVAPTTPIAHFDIDPRTPAAQVPPTALGPTMIAWLHVLTILLSATALAISVAAGGALRWTWIGLAAVGVVAAATHLGGPVEQWLQVGAWVSAACVGVAAAHLAQHDLPRRWMVAALIALLVPLALAGAFYVLVEHPMTVEDYRQRKAEILASRGWTEGSSSAEIFERRATDPSVIGAYGLSNVFGSVIGGLTLLALGTAAATFRRETLRHAPAWWVLPAVTLFGGVTLVLTQSKGAAAAVLAGLGLLVLIELAPRWRLPRWAAAAGGAGLVVAAILAVFLRGWIGAPETWEGERSLLFRWYYWEAAARSMAAASPVDWLRGIGPERFHVEYELHKNPLSPEVVTSTHSVFVDWATMLGIGGLAWGALLLVWIVRPLAVRGTDDPVDPFVASAEPHPGLVAAALAAVVFGTQYFVRVSQLWIDSVLVWLLGVIGFIAVASLLAPFFRPSARVLGIGALVAATTIVVHAQIEMTFFHYPALPMAWLLVGLGGGSAAPRRSTETGPRGIGAAAGVAAAMAALAVALVPTYAAPMTSVQARLADAASAMQQGQPMAALDALDAAGRIAPADPRILRWRVQLRLEWASEASRVGARDQLEPSLGAALVLLDRDHEVIGPMPDRLRSSIHQLAGDITGSASQYRRAAEARAAAVELSPYNLEDVLTLAALRESVGDDEAARQAWRRALRLSEQKYLDPAEQLDPQRRATIEAKLNASP